MMDTQTLWPYIDHTLLKPTASWTEVQTLCAEALEKKAASVCIPPSFVARIQKTFGDLNICTVIGFPLGYHTTRIKVEEARAAMEDGAGELDMMINLGEVKAGNFEALTGEIAALREISAGRVLKVIVETCYLTEAEKIKLCGCVSRAGADYIKTSTGFGSAGATVADVKLFARHIGPGVKIKASGGVSTREELLALIEAGASRIGTSRGMTILG
ncbi:MAG: deoxyribose-phosphate aldolase [Treponema sp.]|jgi:deoxyribose-phosphate aldolase|nr:deoxyribose-phosphate aldolase [Treponema sp.]